MKETWIFLFLALFLVGFIGVISAAVGPPCDNEQLREMSEYIIQGEVTSSEITETFNLSNSEGVYATAGKVSIEIKVLNSIKGDNQVEDLLPVNYQTILEGFVAGGNYYNLFEIEDLVEYKKLGEAYDQTCEFQELVAIAEISDNDEGEIDDVDGDNGHGNDIDEANRIKTKLQERNRLRINQSELPEGCTATGSVLKCNVDGGRVMAVMAGNSGNTILQVKGINASTKVQLYKENDSFYGILDDNETILINYFPDQVREMIRNRIHADAEYEDEIELDNNGLYRIKTKKKARLFYLIPVREKVRAQVDPETGEIIKIRNPWWGFLAKDVIDDDEEQLVGESCGTVNPDNVDECCQNKGYDMWDAELSECVLSE